MQYLLCVFLVQFLLNGLHKPYTIKALFVCHELNGKSGIRLQLDRTSVLNRTTQVRKTIKKR